MLNNLLYSIEGCLDWFRGMASETGQNVRIRPDHLWIKKHYVHLNICAHKNEVMDLNISVYYVYQRILNNLEDDI